MKLINSLIILLINIAPLLYASAIEVTPTKIFLDQNKKITYITVKNLSKQKVFMQAELLNWQQNKNKNIYTPSNELILSPLIFAIEPQQEQIVRVGQKKNYKQIKQELSFRLLLSELPDQFKIASGLKMMLRLNLPIFIEPDTKESIELQWSKKINPDKNIKLSIYNPNNVHKLINKIELKNKLNEKLYDKQNAFIYLLPKQKHTWTINKNDKLVKYISDDKNKHQDLTMTLNTANGLSNAIAVNENISNQSKDIKQSSIALNKVNKNNKENIPASSKSNKT